jgi:hypothetical protein
MGKDNNPYSNQYGKIIGGTSSSIKWEDAKCTDWETINGKRYKCTDIVKALILYGGTLGDAIKKIDENE